MYPCVQISDSETKKSPKQKNLQPVLSQPNKEYDRREPSLNHTSAVVETGIEGIFSIDSKFVVNGVIISISNYRT